MIITKNKIEGEIMVTGYFSGLFTNNIAQKNDGKIYAIALCDVSAMELSRYRHRIGAIVARESDRLTHNMILARELSIPIIMQDLLPQDNSHIEIGEPSSNIASKPLAHWTKTADGRKISLFHSISSMDKLRIACEDDNPVGLVRSEFFGDSLQEMYASCNNLSHCVLRLFDFDGDKSSLQDYEMEHERSLQIANIIENCPDCQILIPNVQSADEIVGYKEYISTYCTVKTPLVGSMIETEEAIRNYKSIMKCSDFCSIGINSMQRLGKSHAQIKRLCQNFVKYADSLYQNLYACSEFDENIIKVLVKSGITKLVLPMHSIADCMRVIERTSIYNNLNMQQGV